MGLEEVVVLADVRGDVDDAADPPEELHAASVTQKKTTTAPRTAIPRC
jgi:hypothetical protein